MDCVESCGYNNLSLSRVVVRDKAYQIRQIGKTKCFVSISRQGLTRETLAKTSCHHPVLNLRIPVMYWAHASLHEKASRKLPANTSLLFTLP